MRRKKIGRPRVALSGGLSAEAHEARRMTLNLSKRAYAENIGMTQANYCAKTKHVKVPRKPSSMKPTATLDFVTAAGEFLRLRPQYVKSLEQELVAAEKAVVTAKNRVLVIQKLLADLKRPKIIA